MEYQITREKSIMLFQIDHEIVRRMGLTEIIEMKFLAAEIDQQAVFHKIGWLVLCIDVLLQKLVIESPSAPSFSVRYFSILG